MYQTALEGLLGLRRHGDVFSVDPTIPATWPRYSIEWTVGQTLYRITVLNPDHQVHGVRLADVDGTPVDAHAIPIIDDGAVHEVTIVLGAGAPSDAQGERVGAKARYVR
jgi:cyclic beta-1,2-glucan synthetase